MIGKFRKFTETNHKNYILKSSFQLLVIIRSWKISSNLITYPGVGGISQTANSQTHVNMLAK